MGGPQQAGQMTGCRLAGSEDRQGGIKPQKLPWSCACRHCGVNVPPSGLLSRLKESEKVCRAESQRHRGAERGGRDGTDAWRERWRCRGKGTEKTETEMWKER